MPGHASIQITPDIYSHVTPGLQEAAAARQGGDFSFENRRRESDSKQGREGLSLAVYLLWCVVTFETVFFFQYLFSPFVRKTPPPVAPFVFIR